MATKKTRNIGILALQGSVAEHAAMLKGLRVGVIYVRDIDSLAAADALIIPGGESTAIANLLKTADLFFPLIERINCGMPVWGTCAGAILISSSIEGETRHLGVMDITIKRNAYGRQIDSFIATENIKGIGSYPLVFVRAPVIVQAGEGVSVLARHKNQIVMARQNNMLATTFHPELTNDNRVHKYFVERML